MVSPKPRILIRNGTVVTSDAARLGDVVIEGEKILDVGLNLAEEHATVIDASDRLVIPGGIDVHTHMEAPVGGMTSSDDFETGTRAAAFGGTTTVIDFATPSPGERLSSAHARWLNKGEKACVDFGLHMIVTDAKSCPEIPALVAAGVTSFKVFMAYPGVLMLDDDSLRTVMEACAKHRALTCVHAEDGDRIEALVRGELQQGHRAPIFHARSRPPATETDAVHRAISIARKANASLYVVHVSTAGGLEEILRARTEGQRVHAETCPHYLYLSERELSRPDFDGAKFVLTPPLREESHGERLRQGLTRAEVDVVATDHCPFMFSGQKDRGRDDFTRIPNGGPGIEHRLQLLFHEEVNAGMISLQRWVDLAATNPAKIFGLFPRKGTIAAGSDADLVIWNPRTPLTISSATHHMHVDYSMYEGRSIRGTVETVFLRGKTIVRHGEWLGGRGDGKYLPRATVQP